MPTTPREELPFSLGDSIGDRIPEMAIAAGPSAAGAVSPSRVRFAVACDTYQAATLKPAAAARKRWRRIAADMTSGRFCEYL